MSTRSPGPPPGSSSPSATPSSRTADTLVAVAATSTVDAFERHVADLARRLEGDSARGGAVAGAAIAAPLE